ncbi:hypothetical protein CMMCAS03_11970 [Clavibacter michiganensis subsp. michiganensis]|nr:hypothetical protein CMMCAS03_11970 [Clavibacter michiganensis subsp. michiganensis]
MRPDGAASTAFWMLAYGDAFVPAPVFEPVGDT